MWYKIIFKTTRKKTIFLLLYVWEYSLVNCALVTKRCMSYNYQNTMSWSGTRKTDLSQCSAEKEARVATLRLRRNDDDVVYISRIGCLRLCIWGGLLHHSWLGRRLGDVVCYVCVSVRCQRQHNSPSTHATTTASFASPPSSSSSRRPIHTNSHFPVDDVVEDDVDADGWWVRWWLLIDNVIYIIASTTKSILARLPSPRQAPDGQF